MRLTLLPAGTTGDDARDRDLIAKLEDAVGDHMVWGCQVIMPNKQRYVGPLNVTERRVTAALRRAERLPVTDYEVYLNYEATHNTHIQRARALNAAAREVVRQCKRPPSGAYAVPRISYEGDWQDIGGWVHEAYASATRTFCPSCYIWQDRMGHRPLDRLMRLAELLGYSVRPYVGGQYRGDGDLVPTIALREQARDYTECGVVSAVIWCNIATARAVEGVKRCVEAFA